jgi:predicted nuclease of restriction endonuclease-like (RecB) superfamily
MESTLTETTNFVADIRHILAQARQKACAAINFSMIDAYWMIGKRIVEEELQGGTRAAYGEEIIQKLSIELTGEFGKGFSYANLKNFKQFYLTYPGEQLATHCVANLSWSHNRLIMRVEDEQAHLFYLREAAQQQWSVRVLERNINTFYYQRILSSKKRENAANTEILSGDAEKHSVEDFIKDPYLFEFLNMPESIEANEKKIEAALIDNFQKFLLELGKGFSFVGRQFRISTETTHFYIDLVFYNYILKCFVLFDIKTSKLSHQDIGQMDMYVRLFDHLKRRSDDGPTIGIILCAEKDETVVKFSVLNENQQLFATKYIAYLPTEEEIVAEVERSKHWIANTQQLQDGAKPD